MRRIAITAALLAATITPALSEAPPTPEVRLASAYTAFPHISWCHDVREGYAYQAISAAELDRAQTVVKSVAAQATKEDASIDTAPRTGRA